MRRPAGASHGAGFAGFASWLDMTPADPDVFAIPDPDSLIQLPWKREVGWLAADPWMNGKPVAHAPRNVLKKIKAKAAKARWRASANSKRRRTARRAAKEAKPAKVKRAIKNSRAKKAKTKATTKITTTATTGKTARTAKAASRSRNGG